MKYTFVILQIVFLSIYLGCAAHTNLQPVGKGKLNSNLSFGGPIVEAFGARVASSLCYNWLQLWSYRSD